MPKKPKKTDDLVKKAITASLGPKLRAARKARGVTQEAVAKAIGCSTEFYARVERGNALMSVPRLLAVADYFDISVDELLGDAAKPDGPHDIFDTLSPKVRDAAEWILEQDHDTMLLFNRLLTLCAKREGRAADGESDDGDSDDGDSGDE